MRKTYMAAAALSGLLALAAGQARAATANVTFNGPGVSGALVLTFGAATDAKYPQAYEVTGISGTFSDSNNGLNIINAPVLGLVPINRATPEPDNLLAPKDFSRFAVATGLPPDNNGFLTYDNLLWPSGSPQTATDYPFSGGFLDIYGLMFDIGGGRVVDFWSNGDTGGGVDYGVAVATTAVSLDYVSGGVSAAAAIPEPGSLWLLAGGLLGLLLRRRAANA
jgi:PEP-CTERM motif-containing protein